MTNYSNKPNFTPLNNAKGNLTGQESQFPISKLDIRYCVLNRIIRSIRIINLYIRIKFVIR